MKKLCFWFLLLFISTVSFGQSVKSEQTGEIKELKEITGKYCNVLSQHYMHHTKWVKKGEDRDYLFVGTNEFGRHNLVDEKGDEIKFETVIQVCNYMYIHGWELIEVITTGDGFGVTYFFERKD